MKRQVVLGCGVLSSVLYLAADVLGSRRYGGYRPTSQAFSELLAAGAPTRPLMAALTVPYNLLAAAFGAGVWTSPGRKPAAHRTGALLVTYAACSAAGGPVFNMDRRGAKATARGALHPLATGVMALSILLTVATGSGLHGKRFRAYSLATLLTVLGFGALGALDAPKIAANRQTPWLGAVERVNIYAWMLWVAVLAISLWPVHSSPTRGFRLAEGPF